MKITIILLTYFDVNYDDYVVVKLNRQLHIRH